jgi:16S rRNA processing protein RimM
VFASGSVVQATGARRDQTPLAVESSRPFKDGWLVKFAGIADKTEADKWRGVELSADESSLAPPDVNEVYLDELVGMAVHDEPNGELGVVVGFYELPNGLVLEVRGANWHADIPFNEAFITKLDRAARTIAVQLPDGLLEPAKRSST